VWFVTSTPHGEDEHAPGTGRRDVLVAVSGLRQPVVIVLLLIAFFSAIAGKPLDGLLMLFVAAGLAWDARRRPGVPLAESPGAPQAPAVSLAPAGGRSWLRGPGRPGLVVFLGLLAAGILYTAVVGSFIRFSWPATIAVVGVGAGIIVMSWHGPVRRRPVPGPLPRLGAGLWGGTLLAGGLWELWSLSQQPSLDTTSWAHPTISALTDPLLASHPGRSLALGVWLLLGWYLVRR
jgi:hypothetical protein